MKITDSYSIDQDANRHFTRNTDNTIMTFLSPNSIEDLIRKGQKTIEHNLEQLDRLKYKSNGGQISLCHALLRQFPGHVYGMIGEYLSEKLPLIIFTNRTSFEVCLTYQITSYQQYLEQARSQKQQFEEIMHQIPGKKLEILQEINEITEIIRVYDQITANLVSFIRIIN